MEIQQDILAGIEEQSFVEYATTGQRFANSIIDSIAIYAIDFIMLIIVNFVNATSPGAMLAVSLFIMVAGFFYYFFMEGVFGKTLGKMVTGTKVVKEDGSVVQLGDAALRTLCRVIPFEPLSIFSGRPWHDRWTRTVVIKAQR